MALLWVAPGSRWRLRNPHESSRTWTVKELRDDVAVLLPDWVDARDEDHLTRTSWIPKNMERVE